MIAREIVRGNAGINLGSVCVCVEVCVCGRKIVNFTKLTVLMYLRGVFDQEYELYWNFFI